MSIFFQINTPQQMLQADAPADEHRRQLSSSQGKSAVESLQSRMRAWWAAALLQQVRREVIFKTMVLELHFCSSNWGWIIKNCHTKASDSQSFILSAHISRFKSNYLTLKSEYIGTKNILIYQLKYSLSCTLFLCMFWERDQTTNRPALPTEPHP